MHYSTVIFHQHFVTKTDTAQQAMCSGAFRSQSKGCKAARVLHQTALCDPHLEPALGIPDSVTYDHHD